LRARLWRGFESIHAISSVFEIQVSHDFWDFRHGPGRVVCVDSREPKTFIKLGCAEEDLKIFTVFERDKDNFGVFAQGKFEIDGGS
jgi:hypothetical protein